MELTDEFKANYEKWLEREVFGTNIQWEQLLGNKHLYCKLNLAVVVFLQDGRDTIDKKAILISF